jgi:hypothetical protein
MQDSTSAVMIFGVAEIVSFLPAGSLEPGDIVEVEDLGVLAHHMRPAS